MGQADALRLQMKASSVTEVPTGNSVKLLEHASWLCAGLGAADAEEAKRTLVVQISRHEPGEWIYRPPPPAVGLLILSGRIARGLRVDDASAHGLELLGEGDLIRPWTFQGSAESVPSRADWEVLAPVELAVLDLTYVRATIRWPRIGINLLDAVVERARVLSYFLTVRQVPRLEARVLATLWALADRWGHVSPEGVVVDLPKLTHDMIARMVAARRPSVTTGIRHLRELGLLESGSNGRWILHGDPVDAMDEIRRHLPDHDWPQPAPAST